jgi:MYXO-CTERM domain-containing protein
MLGHRSWLALLFAFSITFGAARDAAAQATCVDATGDMCLNVVRTARADGVVEDIFQTSDGRYAPDITFASLIRGVNGCIGQTYNPLILEGYNCCTPPCGAPGGDDPTFHANDLDWYWTQVLRTRPDGVVVADGETGNYVPNRARIYDLGGEANRVVLFPITDHPPLPCEAFEYTVWLSNDPDATDVAPTTAPDPRMWNPALLIRAFTQGWTRNPAATSAARGRPDLATYLRDTSAGDAVADALATVWALPCGISFRYVAIQAGNEGNPGPECAFHSSDDELDAVAGLNEDDTAICVDADGDGHRDAACGGGDCDDTDPAVHPGAFEPCNATRDFDCLPAQPCPEGTACDEMTGLCVPQCFEGGCATGFTCVGDRCIDPACAGRAEPCPAGTLCRGGECVEPCAGVVCPRGQLCAGGACVDPCAGVVCPANQVCVADDPDALTVCGPACTCTELAVPLCPSDEACDAREESPTHGECVDPGCEVAVCASTEVCVGGSCIDACEGVSCPGGQVCRDGDCLPDLCSRIVCPTGLVCRDGECHEACTGVDCPSGMTCRDGACVPDPCAGVDCGAGARCVAGECVPDPTFDGGGSGMDGGSGSGPGSSEPGCACRAAGAHGDGRGALLFGALVLIVLVSRRRRG